MAHDSTILLSGITGAVGSWIAREACRRGHRIAALVRETAPETTEARVASALDAVGAEELLSSVEIVPGDILETGCGLDGCGSRLPPLDSVVHCAAWTSFDESESDLVRRTNVDGTRNMLRLAAALRTPFVYVSTAYVAGRRQGVITEAELDTGQSFNNTYERTKCEAENLVREWAEAVGLPVTILRPSIVVGDSERGRIARFNTLYDFMRAFEIASRRRSQSGLRVTARPEVTKNLIPVDYVAQASCHIIERGLSGTYHLTNPNPPTVRGLREIFSRLFEVDVISLVEEEDFVRREPTRAEQLYRKATAVYTPYMLVEPRFDRTNTDAALADTTIEPPTLDLQFFTKALAYAQSVRWGSARRAAPPASLNPGIRMYFDEFLVGKMHQQFLPNLRSLTADFRIALSDFPGCHWGISIVRGQLERVSANGHEPECSFVLDSPTLKEIIASRLTPQRAFFGRRVEIDGDIETGLKLATRLAAFFASFPYDPGSD